LAPSARKYPGHSNPQTALGAGIIRGVIASAFYQRSYSRARLESTEAVSQTNATDEFPKLPMREEFNIPAQLGGRNERHFTIAILKESTDILFAPTANSVDK
jgi:hypothetical protein